MATHEQQRPQQHVEQRHPNRLDRQGAALAAALLVALALLLGAVGCHEQPPIPAVKVTDQSPLPRNQVVINQVFAEGERLVVVREAGSDTVLGVAPVSAGKTELVTVALVREVRDGERLEALLVDDGGVRGTYEPESDRIIRNPLTDEEIRTPFAIRLVTAELDVANESVESFSSVPVARVVSDGPGWVRIYEDDNGEPGKAIGQVRVPSGESSGVTVPLDRDITNGERLYAALHVDLGVVGEFDEPDVMATSAQGPPLVRGFNTAATVNAWFGRIVGWIAFVFFATVPGLNMPLVVLWLFAGALFLTFRMGFANVRLFRHAVQVVRGRYDDPRDSGEVSHFQALASALSATVGLGNIAGVAIAVSIGGPGATFWMIVVGLLGMTAKMVECTLGQIYRRVSSDGSVIGGAMLYLSEGLAKRRLGALGKVLAVMFVVLCIGGSFGGGNAFQVNQSLNVLGANVPFFAEHKWVYGLVMVVAVGLVIVGGIKRIGAIAGRIVPLMCCLYLAATVWILMVHVTEIPSAMTTIFVQAFSPNAAYGGFIGVLVVGVTRAAFSNEAGIGSAAIAHSAARTKYPVREGIVALLEPFIDTVVVCTMTALVIVITEAYADPAYSDLIASRSGAALTSAAMGSVISWFPWVLTLATVLFAYSTMISWSYYGERCFVWLFGERSSLLYKILFMVFTFLGSIVTATNVLDLSDLMILGMAFPNVLGLYIMSGEVKQHLDAYVAKLRSGELDAEAAEARRAAAAGAPAAAAE